MAHTKARYQVLSDGSEPDDGEQAYPSPNSPEFQKVVREQEAETGLTYDCNTGIFDFRKLKVTSLKQNSKVFLPPPLAPVEESMMALRSEKYMAEFKKYTRDNCNDRGDQVSNLTKMQERGLKSLISRQKRGEVKVIQTDKSGKFALVTPQLYSEMGEVHTCRDKQISMLEVEETQAKMKGHVSMWTRIFNIGDNWNHRDRIRESNQEDKRSSQNEVAPERP